MFVVWMARPAFHIENVLGWSKLVWVSVDSLSSILYPILIPTQISKHSLLLVLGLQDGRAEHYLIVTQYKHHKERSSEQIVYIYRLLLPLNTATISFFQLYITRYRLCILNTFQVTLGSGHCRMPAPMSISAHTKPSIGKEKRDVITKAMNHHVVVRNTKPSKI